jgi:hypothetical protein
VESEQYLKAFATARDWLIGMSAANKLHPIYAALDAHQYARAIKLASALPDSNVLGKALLAHAYAKSSQRYQSMLVLTRILGPSFFDLEQELELCPEASQQAADASAPKTNQAAESTKKGKKGKKGKPAAKAAPSNAPSENKMESKNELDIFDRLCQPPTLPKDWNQLPPAENAITDEVSIYNGYFR